MKVAVRGAFPAVSITVPGDDIHLGLTAGPSLVFFICQDKTQLAELTKKLCPSSCISETTAGAHRVGWGCGTLQWMLAEIFPGLAAE